MENGKRLIDPAKYEVFLKRYILELHEIDAPMIAGAVERCLYKLEAQPTVDAVEVVRCKECIEVDGMEDGLYHCPYCTDLKKADDFCSYGERKDNG